jgi:hypothetical protein
MLIGSTPDEFELLELILLVDATGSLERCALFCIYIAEWWRKHYDGGPWSWAEPLRALDLHTDDYPKLYKPIRAALLIGVDRCSSLIGRVSSW